MNYFDFALLHSVIGSKFSCLFFNQSEVTPKQKRGSLEHIFPRFVSATCNYCFDWFIHLYHSAAILESVGNKGFVFALSLPVQPHTEWEVRRAKSFVWTLSDMGQLDCLRPFWLAKVITLVLVLRHSIETRSNSPSQDYIHPDDRTSLNTRG